MALATSDSMAAGGAQKPIFGPAVWGWALASGLALWGLGFLLLPWWAALLFWWWPSVFVGAAVGLTAISIAKLMARAMEAKQRMARAAGGPLNMRHAGAAPPRTCAGSAEGRPGCSTPADRPDRGPNGG